jgi:regulator of replication initiation timing
MRAKKMLKWLAKKIFRKEIKSQKEQMKIARDKLVELIEENNELRQEIQELNEMLDLYEEEIKRLERALMIDDIIISTMAKFLYRRR